MRTIARGAACALALFPLALAQEPSHDPLARARAKALAHDQRVLLRLHA